MVQAANIIWKSSGKIKIKSRDTARLSSIKPLLHRYLHITRFGILKVTPPFVRTQLALSPGGQAAAKILGEAAVKAEDVGEGFAHEAREIQAGRAPERDIRGRCTAREALELVEEGISAGGSVALLRTAKAIEALELEGDEAVGAQIVRRAIEAPLRQLCANAGEEGALVVKEVLKSKGSVGYNVATGKFEDLLKAGVVDPTKVTRSALQNAASVASLLLTTECMITDLPEPKPAAPAPGMDGGMGGMM